jgi:hypothetical protein
MDNLLDNSNNQSIDALKFVTLMIHDNYQQMIPNK